LPGAQAQSLWNKSPNSPFNRVTLPPTNPSRPASAPPTGSQRAPAPAATARPAPAPAWPMAAPRPTTFLKSTAESAGTPLSGPRPALQRPSAGMGAASPFRKDLRVSDEEFIQLRDFIYEQCGIFIAENRKYLIENRLSSRVKELNLKSYNEYYNFLRFDVSRRTELNKLFEVVTTNETSFYRNPPQLEVFQNVVLRGIVDKCLKAGRKRLRLWSAGCSTGEEPYTLAIILHEVLKSDIAAWDIKITANDLSEAVLNAARRGIYSEYALRTTPPEITSAYFTKDGNVYRIKESLKRIVTFGQINLNDKEQLKRVEKSQVVFCRNVIIYFDDDMKRRVINAYYDNLEPDGVLLIGHSESLHNITRAFQLEQYKGTIVYRKKI
jgi:chemotaxis protein methyltransferase CheR